MRHLVRLAIVRVGGLVRDRFERRHDQQRPIGFGGLDNALLPGFGPGGRARCQAAFPVHPSFRRPGAFRLVWTGSEEFCLLP
jgi:hypothetical protein